MKRRGKTSLYATFGNCFIPVARTSLVQWSCFQNGFRDRIDFWMMSASSANMEKRIK
jgi:hypothetical protein